MRIIDIRKKGVLATYSIFSGAFIISIMAASIFAPANLSNADVLIFDVSDEGYTASVSAASQLDLELTSTPTGTLATTSDTINIVTNNPEGYKLYVSMDNAVDYAVDKPGNALYKDGTSTSTSYIAPSSSSISSPAALGTNEWGFNTVDDSTFAAVPLKSNPEIISTSDSATTAEGDDLDIYYGVNVTSALPSGYYSGVINYSVLADYSQETADSAGIYPNSITTETPTLQSTDITISTNFYTNRTFENTDITVTIGESGQEQTCTIKEVSTSEGHLEARCTLPAYTFQDYDTYTYPVTLSIPSYSKTYTGMTLTITYEKPASDFWSISTMQEMTPEVCATVYTPTNAVSMTDANIITLERYNNGDYTVTSDNSSPLIPERTLLDDRDADGTGTKKSYKVRKLADGNCWMVDNLEYDLLSLYNNGKRGIGSRNDGTTFEMTDTNLATGVEGYYTTTANAFNYVINPNTKPVTNITRQSYLGNVTGQTEYYYNWTAATAGQGSQSDATDGVSIDGSICPAGWRLPTNYNDTTNQNISWSALTNAYLGITANTNTTTGYQTLDQYPINLYHAGRVNSGSQGSTSLGLYWSSTANTANFGYGLYYTTSNVYPQFSTNKYLGFSLRCVASR